MRCNMKVAELQYKLDHAKSRSVASDFAWSDLSNVLSNRSLMIGRIIMYVANYLKQFKKHAHILHGGNRYNITYKD